MDEYEIWMNSTYIDGGGQEWTRVAWEFYEF